jgi:hypothetical protein
MEYNNQSNNKANVPIYIVECAVDDCGWGTIGNNPSLNKSMEDFFDSIKSFVLIPNVKIARKIF